MLKKIKATIRTFCRKIWYGYLSFLPAKNYVVFESHRGLSSNCNPRAIYEEVKHNANFKCVWVVKKHHLAPMDSIPVTKGNLLYYFYLARAKVWVQNGEFSGGLKKPKHTFYINTQHGVPLKKMGREIHYKKEFNNIKKREWDLLVSPNNYSTTIFKRSFCLTKTEILEVGYPRNDIFYKENDLDLIKDNLGIPKNKKVALYAPTWREYDKDYDYYNFFDNININYLQDWVFITRGHHLNKKVSREQGCSFIDVSGPEYDPQELCLISDVLITDYSSILFDFLHTKKLIVHYLPDYDLYQEYRGLYLDLMENPVGPIVSRTDEIEKVLDSYGFFWKKHQGSIESYYNQFCSNQHPESSKIVASYIVSKLSGCSSKESILLNFLLFLKKSRKRHKDWKQHGLLFFIINRWSSLISYNKFKKDYLINSKIRGAIPAIKDKVLILGNAENLNLLTKEKLAKLRKDHFVIGLNRACIGYEVDITLWADNKALFDIVDNNKLNNSDLFVQVSCDTKERKVKGTKFWHEHKNLAEWNEPYFFMARNILTSAFYLSYLIGAKEVKMIGVDLESRSYFCKHPFENKRSEYEIIDSYYINKDHYGYTSQKIVKEVAEDIISKGIKVVSLYRNDFLTTISGIGFLEIEKV